jgi:hypothetical protein
MAGKITGAEEGGVGGSPVAVRPVLWCAMVFPLTCVAHGSTVGTTTWLHASEEDVM